MIDDSIQGSGTIGLVSLGILSEPRPCYPVRIRGSDILGPWTHLLQVPEMSRSKPSWIPSEGAKLTKRAPEKKSGACSSVM